MLQCLAFVWRAIPIKSYEPCQVRKEAAISSVFMWVIAFHREAKLKLKGSDKVAYTALYRKFRPLTFDEIVGQEHITKTLKNQLIAGRVGHAYLFNGCRGTGKTSAAKILARAVNCLNPKNGEPCNECEICKAALSGSLTDIVEMDAASNNSVEDIRLIRDEVNFLPTLAKYRVYIIDEVHMLSTGAFNALLKTLEEPPAHVKFILATTEPQKLPATILSRCQRFDFKKISLENIVKRLKIVCESSKIDADENALKIVASLSEGAMRDALSILERCLQDGDNEINEDKVKELVGIPKLTFIEEIVASILEKNVDDCLKTLKIVIDEGKDQNNFLWEVIKYVKDVLLYKVTGETGIYNEKEKQKLNELANKSTKEELVHLIYELSDLENDMKWSSQKTIMIEAGFIKLCDTNKGNVMQIPADISVNQPVNNNDLQELQRRLFKIESFLSQAGKNRIADGSNTSIKKEPTVAKKIERKPLSPEELKKNNFWKDIVIRFKTEGKMGLYTNLLNTNISEINDMTVGINFNNGLKPLAKGILEKPENMQAIAKEISMAYGKEMKVKLIDNHVEAEPTKSEFENLVEGLDIPIDIIE